MHIDKRLNPYYTGIHLHNIIGLLFLGGICLNPYYTGIHLHSASNKGMADDYRLNPYYTGIHLHYKDDVRTLKQVQVLILIILEYIYMLEHLSREEAVKVS